MRYSEALPNPARQIKLSQDKRSALRRSPFSHSENLYSAPSRTYSEALPAQPQLKKQTWETPSFE